jgi:hypothetical protein
MVTFETAPLGTRVKRLMDNKLGTVVNHQDFGGQQAFGVDIDGEIWSGTSEAWEVVSPREELRLLIHAARQAAHEAGYAQARYVHDHFAQAEHLRDENQAARAKADAAMTALWRAFYDLASEED